MFGVGNLIISFEAGCYYKFGVITKIKVVSKTPQILALWSFAHGYQYNTGGEGEYIVMR